MATTTKVNPWLLIRWGLVVCWSFGLIILTILDYGREYSLWQNVTLDPVGWWHEIAFWTLGMIVALDLTYYWEKKSRKVVYILRKV